MLCVQWLYGDEHWIIIMFLMFNMNLVYLIRVVIGFITYLFDRCISDYHVPGTDIQTFECAFVQRQPTAK